MALTPAAPALAVARHAARRPEDPALVFPAPAGWRWRSWRWLAAAVETQRVALGPADGAVIASAWQGDPLDVVDDLAVQAAGGCSAASAAPHDLPAPAAAGRWLARRRASPWPGWQDVAPVPAPGSAEPAAPATAAWAPGGVALRMRGAWRCVEGEALAEAAARLDALLPPPAPRHFALLCGDPAEPAERAWWSWAVTSGALLVLAPAAEAAWAIHWCRPTVACLPGVRLGELADDLAEVEPRGALRRRLRRLRALAWHDSSPAPEAVAWWRDLGVETLPLPSFLPGRGMAPGHGGVE